jgi:DNA-directed RNA polymerase subunit RPC12/RpoP
MRDKTKKAIAINLNAVNCPKCSTRQPALRLPMNWRQFFFGGWTCARCHTEMDKFGRPVF